MDGWMDGWSRQRGRNWWGMLHVCGENRNAYNNLARKPEGKKLLGNREMEGEKLKQALK
jgi:hypothetical protein